MHNTLSIMYDKASLVCWFIIYKQR